MLLSYFDPKSINICHMVPFETAALLYFDLPLNLLSPCFMFHG